MWRVSEHAVRQYRDRVKPAMSVRRARRDLLAVLRVVRPELQDGPPAWHRATEHDDCAGWIVVADLTFPVASDGKTLKTCIPRNSVTEAARARLNRRKSRRIRRPKTFYLRGQRRSREEALWR